MRVGETVVAWMWSTASWSTTVHVTRGERTCCERGGLQAGLPIVPFCVPCIGGGLGRRVGQTLLLLSRFCRPLWQQKTTTAGQLLIDRGAEPKHVIGADICFSCSCVQGKKLGQEQVTHRPVENSRIDPTVHSWAIHIEISFFHCILRAAARTPRDRMTPQFHPRAINLAAMSCEAGGRRLPSSTSPPPPPP